MKNIFNHSQLEQILLIAARLPTMGLKYVS